MIARRPGVVRPALGVALVLAILIGWIVTDPTGLLDLVQALDFAIN